MKFSIRYLSQLHRKDPNARHTKGQVGRGAYQSNTKIGRNESGTQGAGEDSGTGTGAQEMRGGKTGLAHTERERETLGTGHCCQG